MNRYTCTWITNKSMDKYTKMDGWMDVSIDGQIKRLIHEMMDGRKNKWKKKRMDE